MEARPVTEHNNRNVVDFTTHKHRIKSTKTVEREVFQLNMYESSDNEFSVFMEIGEEYSEFEAWIALECAAVKMGVENGFITENENGETIYNLESEEDDD